MFCISIDEFYLKPVYTDSLMVLFLLIKKYKKSEDYCRSLLLNNNTFFFEVSEEVYNRWGIKGVEIEFDINSGYIYNLNLIGNNYMLYYYNRPNFISYNSPFYKYFDALSNLSMNLIELKKDDYILNFRMLHYNCATFENSLSLIELINNSGENFIHELDWFMLSYIENLYLSNKLGLDKLKSKFSKLQIIVSIMFFL